MVGSINSRTFPDTTDGVSVVAELAAVSVAAPVGVVASQVATLAARLVHGLDVGVAVVQHQKVLGVAFGDHGLGAVLDERQYPAGYGPALVAARSGRVVRMNERLCDPQHEDFRQVAARHGVRDVRSWPLLTPSSETCAGSLSVYRGPAQAAAEWSPGGDGDPDHHFARFLAAAAVVVRDTVLFHSAVLTAQQLEQAMQSRAVIEQAKGMIMAKVVCTDQEAFEQLSHLASTSNRKLREVAAAMVREASGPRVPVLSAPARRTRETG